MGILQKLRRKKEENQKPELTEQDQDNDAPVEKSKPKPITNQELIIMRLIAPQDKPYSGYELLQALLSNGFRFGTMNIFHHYEKSNNEGKILYSLASATEPGTFDIRNMGNCSCSGLTIFMRLSDHENPYLIFENMIEISQKLTEDLGGILLNEMEEKVDQSIIAKWHNKIKNYQNSLYTYDLFETD